MNVNFNIGQSPLQNISQINQSIAVRGGGNSERASKTDHTDRVSISPLGKKNNLLDQLMKQKANILKQKDSLVHSALETGGSLDSIQSQLNDYDEQLKNIDDQMTELKAGEMKKQADKAKTHEDHKLKTEEEIQNERLADVVSLAGHLQQAKTVHSVQARVNGEASVLKSEIELDKMHSGSSAGSKEIIAKKEESLANLERKSMALSSELSDKLSDIDENGSDLKQAQKLTPPNEAEAAEQKEDESGGSAHTKVQ